MKVGLVHRGSVAKFFPFFLNRRLEQKNYWRLQRLCFIYYLLVFFSYIWCPFALLLILLCKNWKLFKLIEMQSFFVVKNLTLFLFPSICKKYPTLHLRHNSKCSLKSSIFTLNDIFSEAKEKFLFLKRFHFLKFN